MTGPEHYAEAERLLDEDRNAGPWDDGDDVARSAAMMAAAQVHATLALAAAQAANSPREIGRMVSEGVRRGSGRQPW